MRGIPVIRPSSVFADASIGRRAVHLSGTAYGAWSRTTDWQPRVSVVVPAMNEALNLPFVFAGMPEVFEVVLVDGGSSDDTVRVARELFPSVRVVHQTSKGKGAALAEGFAACSGDIIAMLDADGSASAAEIPRFVDALMGGFDFAKGTRFAQGGGSADITRLRHLGNFALSSLVNGLYGTQYTDLCYGMNAFWADCLPQFDIDSPGFEVETQINVRLARSSLRVVEVPSYEHRRVHGASNLNAVTDGLRVLRTIVRERVRPAPTVLASTTTAPPSVSGVLLATDDGLAVEKAVTAAHGALRDLGLPDFEVIVVNDLPNGAPLDAVSRLARRLPEVRLLPYEAGRHRGTALRSGMRAARCEAVWIVDDAEPELVKSDVRQLLPHFARRTVVARPVRKRRKRLALGSGSVGASGVDPQPAGEGEGADDDWAIKLLPRSLSSTMVHTGVKELLLTSARKAGYRVLRLPAQRSRLASVRSAYSRQAGGPARTPRPANDFEQPIELRGVPLRRSD